MSCVCVGSEECVCFFWVLWSLCACVRSKGCVPVLVLQVCVCVDLRGNVPVLGSKGVCLGIRFCGVCSCVPIVGCEGCMCPC